MVFKAPQGLGAFFRRTKRTLYVSDYCGWDLGRWKSCPTIAAIIWNRLNQVVGFPAWNGIDARSGDSFVAVENAPYNRIVWSACGMDAKGEAHCIGRDTGEQPCLSYSGPVQGTVVSGGRLCVHRQRASSPWCNMKTGAFAERSRRGPRRCCVFHSGSNPESSARRFSSKPGEWNTGYSETQD